MPILIESLPTYPIIIRNFWNEIEPQLSQYVKDRGAYADYSLDKNLFDFKFYFYDGGDGPGISLRLNLTTLDVDFETWNENNDDDLNDILLKLVRGQLDWIKNPGMSYPKEKYENLITHKSQLCIYLEHALDCMRNNF